jgi:hypothetical protein
MEIYLSLWITGSCCYMVYSRNILAHLARPMNPMANPNTARTKEYNKSIGIISRTNTNKAILENMIIGPIYYRAPLGNHFLS